MLGEVRQKEIIEKLNRAQKAQFWVSKHGIRGDQAPEPLWIRTWPHPESIIERAIVASHPNENNLTVQSWQVQLLRVKCFPFAARDF